jgi:hypothetical protein
MKMKTLRPFSGVKEGLGVILTIINEFDDHKNQYQASDIKFISNIKNLIILFNVFYFVN